MRRIIIAASVAAGLAAGLAAPAPSFADWPNDRPIRILVGFGAGGGTDIVTRIIAQALSEVLHQSVVVENKPGAGGSLASDMVAKAAPDGYTATMLSTGHTVSAAMMKSLPFDPVKDFTPVAMVASSCLVIVARKDLPADDIKGLIALAKAEPGKLNFGTVGLGSTQHMSGELFREMSDIKVKHIPYRGTPMVLQALRNKEIDYAVELLQAVIGQVNAGDVKLLAVAPPNRWPTVPNVPSIGETVPGYAVVGWYGLVFPAATPPAIVEKMNAALRTVLARPAIREQLSRIGAEVNVTSARDFGNLLSDEVGKWKLVRDKAGLEPQ
jgi:tripartite-type tricarboxylate transporter receptor subunit TctC